MTKKPFSLVFFSLAILLHSPVMSQEITTGSIEGVVTDDQGSAIAGATVTLSSNQGTKTQTTDSNGRFRFPYLTVGSYELSATAEGFTTSRYQTVAVRLGSLVPLDVILKRGLKETVTVTNAAPVVDLNTATSGATVSDDLMISVPMARTFSSALAFAPGVVESGMPGSSQSNPSSGGASGLENVTIVDGVNINSPGFGAAGGYNYMYGTPGTGVNFDYIKEIQVKTGGYGPEFGEALGAYINVVTKTGTNQVEGSTFGYLQSDDMEADHVRTDRINASSDIISTQTADFGVELGGPLVANRAFWYFAFDPTFTSLTRRTSQAIIESQGIDHTLTSNRTIYNYAGNVKWFLNPRHTFTASAFGDPAYGRMGPQRVGLFGDDPMVVANPVARFSEIEFGGHNASVRWEGELSSNWLGEASIGYHRDKFEETLALSQHQGIDYRTAVPTNYGGVGYGQDTESSNIQYALKLSNIVQAAGKHEFRYGTGFQDVRHDNTTNYSGSPSPFLDSSGNTLMSSTGFIWSIPPPDSTGYTTFNINRIRVGPKVAETKSRYLSFFLSDTWSPTDYLSIMAGVRYEEVKLIGNLSEFKWDGNWAPRTHIAWDPTKDNRSKLSFAFGRFFGKIPNQLAVRTLSSEVTYILGYDLSNVDLSNPVEPRITGPADWEFVFGDQPGVVDPESKLSYQDEYIVSAEREVLPLFSVGLSYMHRRLGRALEDVALVPYSTTVNTGEFGEYYVTNPTPELGFPKPTRKYNAVTVKADKRWSDNWQVLGSYTWSRLKGNYEGYFRRDNNQPDPFMTSVFDWPYLKDPTIFQHLIEEGYLPNDRTHVVNLYGSYRFGFNLNAGLGLRVQSGIPLTRMGYNIPYASYSEIPLEPRGASGRSPSTADIGVHLDYAFSLGDRSRLELIFDVFNLFNQRDGLNYDLAWEREGVVNPDPSLNVDPCPECQSPDFGKPTVFQNPRRIRLALRSRF